MKYAKTNRFPFHGGVVKLPIATSHSYSTTWAILILKSSCKFKNHSSRAIPAWKCHLRQAMNRSIGIRYLRSDAYRTLAHDRKWTIPNSFLRSPMVFFFDIAFHDPPCNTTVAVLHFIFGICTSKDSRCEHAKARWRAEEVRCVGCLSMANDLSDISNELA